MQSRTVASSRIFGLVAALAYPAPSDLTLPSVRTIVRVFYLPPDGGVVFLSPVIRVPRVRSICPD